MSKYLERHKKHAGRVADEEQSQNLKLFISDSTLSAKDDEANTWFMDSIASIHMTGNKQSFKYFKETRSGVNIYLGDDRGYQIKGYGNILVVFPDGNIKHIHNVMYVPEIKKNLIFVSTITDQNLKVGFYKSYCVIKDMLDCMKPIASSIRVGGLSKACHIRNLHHLP